MACWQVSGANIRLLLYPSEVDLLSYILNQSHFYLNIMSRNYQELVTWQALHRRLFSILESVWSTVRDVLCNDAPEGHIPADFEFDDPISTQDILSYSWRALKEARCEYLTKHAASYTDLCSNLLRVVVSRAPYEREKERTVLIHTDLEFLGGLCFKQLTELRHRGAFSAVAQAFAACCTRISCHQNATSQALLTAWYEVGSHP